MYRRMIGDRKYGLTYSLMASKVLPVLIPHSVNPALNTQQVHHLPVQNIIIIIIIIIIHEFHRDAKLQGRYVSSITLQL